MTKQEAKRLAYLKASSILAGTMQSAEIWIEEKEKDYEKLCDAMEEIINMLYVRSMGKK